MDAITISPIFEHLRCGHMHRNGKTLPCGEARYLRALCAAVRAVRPVRGGRPVRGVRAVRAAARLERLDLVKHLLAVEDAAVLGLRGAAGHICY